MIKTQTPTSTHTHTHTHTHAHTRTHIHTHTHTHTHTRTHAHTPHQTCYVKESFFRAFDRAPRVTPRAVYFKGLSLCSFAIAWNDVLIRMAEMVEKTDELDANLQDAEVLASGSLS